MRKLFLHIGAGKTGTSHLQEQLALQQEELACRGIWYPVPKTLLNRVKKGLVTSGNTIDLLPWFCPYHPTAKKRGLTCSDIQAQEWIANTTREAAGKDILLSSETLQHACAESVKKLKEMCLSHKYEVIVIYYVRHAIDHAISNYKQHLQVGNVASCSPPKERAPSINYWLRTQLVPFQQTIKLYSDIFGEYGINVYSYDAAKDHLLGSFTKELGIGTVQPIERPAQLTNRSLSVTETCFLEKAIYDGMSDQDVAMIGRLLAKEATDIGPKGSPKYMLIDESSLVSFSKNHSIMIDDINKRWKNTLEEELSVIPATFVNGSRQANFSELFKVSLSAFNLVLKEMNVKPL